MKTTSALILLILALLIFNHALNLKVQRDTKEQNELKGWNWYEEQAQIYCAEIAAPGQECKAGINGSVFKCECHEVMISQSFGLFSVKTPKH